MCLATACTSSNVFVDALRQYSDGFGWHAQVLQHLPAIDVFRGAIDPHSSQRFVFNMQRPARQPNLRRPTRVVERSSLDRPEGQMPANTTMAWAGRSGSAMTSKPPRERSRNALTTVTNINVATE